MGGRAVDTSRKSKVESRKSKVPAPLPGRGSRDEWADRPRAGTERAGRRQARRSERIGRIGAIVVRPSRLQFARSIHGEMCRRDACAAMSRPSRSLRAFWGVQR